MYNAMVRYRRALKRCVRKGADGLTLLGDLSWSGDAESLGAGLRLAARSAFGRAVWTVPGNHDCDERVDAMARAVRRVGAENVRLATPSGEVFGTGGVRVAGLCVSSENYGYTAFLDERPDVSGWRDEPVVLMSHYPMISFREMAEREASTTATTTWRTSTRSSGRCSKGRHRPSWSAGTYTGVTPARRRRCSRSRARRSTNRRTRLRSSTSKPKEAGSPFAWSAYRSHRRRTTKLASRSYPPRGSDGSSRKERGTRWKRRSRESKRGGKGRTAGRRSLPSDLPRKLARTIESLSQQLASS